MSTQAQATGKTIEEAIQAALEQLGADREQVTVEVLDKPKSGFLGLGGTPAKVMVTRIDLSPEEKAKEFISGLLSNMGVNAQAQAAVNEEGVITVSISGEDMGTVIGHRGETLDAIQHLAGFAVNRGSESRARVTVDTENYRQKRAESLERLARKTASKTVKLRKNVTLEPMNAYERHIIHATLQTWRDVSTFSTGTEPQRRVVVAYTPGGRSPRTAPQARLYQGGYPRPFKADKPLDSGSGD